MKKFELRDDGTIEITIINESTKQELHAWLFEREDDLYLESEYPEICGTINSLEDFRKLISDLEWEIL